MIFFSAVYYGGAIGFGIGIVIGAIWTRHFIFELLEIYRGKKIARGILGNVFSRSDCAATGKSADR